MGGFYFHVLSMGHCGQRCQARCVSRGRAWYGTFWSPRAHDTGPTSIAGHRSVLQGSNLSSVFWELDLLTGTLWTCAYNLNPRLGLSSSVSTDCSFAQTLYVK